MSRLFPVILAVLLLASCSDNTIADQGTALGDTAPSITAQAEDGHDVVLSDFKGSYVIVEFYASWCGPCHRELPKLKRLYTEHRNADIPLEVISVALEKDKSKGLRFLDQIDFPWSHQILNESKFVRFDALASAYGVTDIPSSFLIGPDGRILASYSSIDEIKSLLAQV